MEKAGNVEKERRSTDVLRVINESDEEIVDRSAGKRLVFPPQSFDYLPNSTIWLWFGDPDLRPGGSAEGSVKMWNKEVARLKMRHGKNWDLISEGKWYFCKCSAWPCKCPKGEKYYHINPETDPDTQVARRSLSDMTESEMNGTRKAKSLEAVIGKK